MEFIEYFYYKSYYEIMFDNDFHLDAVVTPLERWDCKAFLTKAGEML